MATTIVKQLIESRIIGAGVLYQCPLLTVASIQAAVLVNTTAGTVACEVYITPASGTPAADNTLVSVALAAGKPYLCPELINQKISPGYEIHAAGTGVTIAIAGVEIIGQ